MNLCNKLLILSLVFACFDLGNIFAGSRSIINLSSAAGMKWEFKPEGADWAAIQVPAGGWRAQGLTCDASTYLRQHIDRHYVFKPTLQNV